MFGELNLLIDDFSSTLAKKFYYLIFSLHSTLYLLHWELMYYNFKNVLEQFQNLFITLNETGVTQYLLVHFLNCSYSNWYENQFIYASSAYLDSYIHTYLVLMPFKNVQTNFFFITIKNKPIGQFNSIKLTGDFKGMDFNLFPLYPVVTLSYLAKSNTCAPISSHHDQLARLTMHTRNKCTH